MATGKYRFGHPTITNAVGGDPDTGTVWDEAYENSRDDLSDASMDLIEDDVAALQEMTFLRGYDSVIFEYKDAATITIKANGQFVNDDNDEIYTVTADTDVSFTSNLSSDVSGGEAASTLYYVWGGEDGNGDLEFWITDSPTVMPSELVKGKRLRGAIYNDGSSNILPFVMTQKDYRYNTTIIMDGSDTTEVYDAALGTTFTDIDCSAFVPASVSVVDIGAILSLAGTSSVAFSHYHRVNGSGHNGIQVLYAREQVDSGGAVTAVAVGVYQAFVDESGIYEAKNNASVTTKLSVVGYHFS